MDFLARLKIAWPVEAWRDVSVVVAVSGGADSVSLACAMSELREQAAPGKLIVAHFNHRLRAAGEDDARFVQELARQLGLPCEIGVTDQPLEQSGGDGVEAAARTARYAFLLKTAEKSGARYVATAHTADDQAETVLHRVIRGTGLAGLAGIPRVRLLSPAVTLIRPLLDFSRADVVEYLAARQQTFRLDESNEDPSFTRNRIRHALLPQLAAQYNSNVREALLRLGQLAGDAQQVIEQRAEELMQQAVRNSPNGIAIDASLLRDQPLHLVREMLILVWKEQRWPLQQMGLGEWQSLAAALVSEAPNQTFDLPGQIRAQKSRDALTLTKITQ
ncbi:tRNA lysidine(34) synthetase TilS [Anatilimnocola floriformis]|uniref:tRNA lysidine(34) synthetase TilS n=1 Tax=Anatilimnocola floriformis TaxID=2948575 RepID=UPI0020C4897B|nr:tRNA lysidine(34) synthetase TilS [Anatilimnocola floriformis]